MKYQFMPMFWGDFLANTMHLTAQEAGAYLFLIAHAWENDANIAVADLRRVARVGNNHWYLARPRLEQFFTPMKGVAGGPCGGGDYWHHSRVCQELQKATEISDKRKDAAMQMHSKRLILVSASAPASILQLPIKDASLGKGSEAPPERAAGPPAVNRQGSSPDRGLDYRSPPRKKSNNVLAPLSERNAK